LRVGAMETLVSYVAPDPPCLTRAILERLEMGFGRES
jgi:hypothetical protein